MKLEMNRFLMDLPTSCFGVPNFDGAVGAGADNVVTVGAEDGFVDEGRVATELLQRFPRFQTVNADGLSERGGGVIARTPSHNLLATRTVEHSPSGIESRGLALT